MADERFINVLYCEDIRLELGNKRSFMGVFGTQIFVPSLPIALPKLCIFITINTPVHRPFQKLVIKVFNGDRVIAELPVEIESLGEPPLKAPEFPTNSKEPFLPEHVRLQCEAQLIMSPFEITEENTAIRIRAQTESEELRGNRLLISTSAPHLAADAFASSKS